MSIIALINYIFLHHLEGIAVGGLDNTEKLSVWGWNSNSTISWEENQGTDGFKGATFRINLDGIGDIELSCTFTGFAVADIKTPTEFEDSSLLWFV